MRIWLFKLGEPLPIDGAVRLHRYGTLAKMLVASGHDVTWWTSTFNHVHKTQRFDQNRTVQIENNYRLELIHAKGYTKNVSVARVIHHMSVSRSLSRKLGRETPPDVILSSFPTAEVCWSVQKYAEEIGIPTIVDIRDLWPDAFLSIIPDGYHNMIKSGLSFFYRQNRRVFERATGLIATSSDYLDWGLRHSGRKQRAQDRVFYLGYQKTSVDTQTESTLRRELLSRGVDPAKTICCFVGTFGRTYDLETVIEAARALNQAGNLQYQFVLCGDGEKASALQQLSEGLPNVVMLGWVSSSMIKVLIDMSKVGLVTYAVNAPQSLPNKPFEYFSGGLPVVSSLSGELSIILSEWNCGVSYKAGSVESFLGALDEICKDQSRLSAMAQNAEKAYKRHFSASTVYPEMIKYLDEIAKRRL